MSICPRWNFCLLFLETDKEYVFPCRSWLDDREGDGKTWRTLPVLGKFDEMFIPRFLY
jgi:hypothetical protein